MADTPKKENAQTVLVVNDKNDPSNELLLTLVEEEGISLFRDRMGKGFLRGRIGKTETGDPDGTVRLSITKKDGSEVAFSTLFVNESAQDGKHLSAGKGSNIAFTKTPGAKDGITFINIVPAGKGNDGAEITAKIKGVTADEINALLPVYQAKPKTSPKQ